MIKLLKLIYLTIVTLIAKEEEQKPKYDLHKKQESLKININPIMKIIGIIILIIIIVFLIYAIYKTGCIDSTSYYYRLQNL